MEKIVLEQFSFHMPGKNAFITFTEIPKGSLIEAHTHEKPVCNYIVSGSLEISLNGQQPELHKQHSWFEIKPGVSHCVKSIEDTTMIEVWPDGIDE